MFTVRGDMCRSGMSSEDSLGSAPVKKPTGWMTNSLHISDALEKRCSGGHRHVQLTDGRARACQVYPVKLSLQILRGFRKQLQQDGHLGLIGSVCCEDPVEDENFTEENWKIGVDSESTADGEVIYYDDISGAPLKSELVDAAIQEEMDQYTKHEVYTKVPLARCWERTGKKPVGVRWVIVNKGDDENPNVRARLVAKEIKSDSRLDMFAATPPLEAKKFLFSRAATSGWLGAKKGHRKLIFIDIKRAYMYAP